VALAARTARRLASRMPVSWLVLASRVGRALGPRRLAWDALLSFAQASLADAQQARGDLEGAIKRYESALRIAEECNDLWPLYRKQQWQFQLEYCYAMLGRARVEDPLFACDVQPPRKPTVASHGSQLTFAARMTYIGMSIHGFADSESESVSLYLDGTLLRTVNVSREEGVVKFNLTIKRETLAMFPTRSRLEAKTSRDRPLYGPGGVTHLDLTVPHGDGRLLDMIASGASLDKKGTIKPTPAQVKERQDRDLEIYSSVRDFFTEHIGRPIFLMYGTLLGYYRDGDLIPHDDDFDVGYVSDETDPVNVKEETKDIIVELVRAGFTVSFNRRGRLFRVQLDRDATDGCHVDVHPTWFQDGNVWVHNVVSFPADRDDFLPAVDGKLRDTAVSVPGRPVVFLRGNYGPGWKVPDPGFRYYNSAVDPEVRRNLGKALINVGEYKALAERVRRETHDEPGAGRLVSIGSRDLYPLDRFIE